MALYRAPLIFALPLPLNIANARLHWRVKNNAKQAYFADLDALQAAKILPAPPPQPWTKARIASDMFVGNRMDADNAMARHKWPLDWLQTRGYIANDKDLEWAALPAQTISRKTTGINLYLTPHP